MKVKNSDDVYDLIVLLKEVGSTNDKKEVLRSHPAIRAVLQAAYDPYRRYYVSKFPATVKGRGENTFSTDTWNILNGLSSRLLSGNSGRNVLYAHIGYLSSKSGKLMKMIIKKDLRCNINAKIINDVWPGLIPEHNVMLAKDLESDKLKFPCYVSAKIDGLRGTFINGKFYTRTGREYKSLTSFTEQVGPGLSLAGNPVDGELFVFGCKNFDELSGKLRSQSDVKNAFFFIFDILAPNLPFNKRVEIMEHLPLPKGCKVIQHVTCLNTQQITKYYQMCINKGLEGVVVKSVDHLYHGKRSHDWMRLVKEHTADMKLIGVEEGEGKNAGAAGALLCKYKGKTYRVGPGKLTYGERQLIFETKGEFLGSVAQICYKGRTGKGNLRQPRFERWRPDK